MICKTNWNKSLIIILCIIYTVILSPLPNVYAEDTSKKEKAEKITLPKNILNIQKENTFNNVGEDTELLEPSKATKSLLKDSNMKVNNPDVIKMLNESSIQPSPISIGYRASIYLGRWPLNYESDKTSITWDYEEINNNKLNNDKGEETQQLNYQQKEEKKVHGMLTNKVDDAAMIKKMILEKTKQKTKLPLAFTTTVGAETKLEHFYDVPEQKTGVLQAFVPAVNETGNVIYGEVYINLKGSTKKLEIKNVTKQEVGAWIPIQNHASFSFQTK